MAGGFQYLALANNTSLYLFMLRQLHFKNYYSYFVTTWLLLLLLSNGLANAQVFESVARVPATPGNTSPAGESSGWRIVHDAQGNTYHIGRLNGILTVGATKLTLVPGQGSDVYIAKYSAAGIWQWAVQPIWPQDMDNIDLADITIDTQGHLFITGTFACATLRFGSHVLTNDRTIVGGSTIFVAMLDTDGAWQWAMQATSVKNQRIGGIAVGPTGTVTIAGTFGRPAITFGNTTLSVPTVNSTAVNELFVAQLNGATGAWNWAVRGGGASENLLVRDLAVDKKGAAYILGIFTRNLTIGAVTLQSVSSDADVFVAKLTAAHTWVGATRGGGIYPETSHAIALDGQGGVYITGLFQSPTATFGASTITNANVTGGVSDVFVAKLNADLQWQWARQAGGTKDDTGLELSADRNANVYVIGEFFSPTFSIGQTTLINAHPNGFFTDMFVAKLDGDGQWQWAVRAGGYLEDLPNGVTATDQGQIYITGAYVSETASFGSLSLTTTPYFYSGFVARLTSPTVRIQGDTVLCAGAQLTLSAQPIGTATAYRWSTGATTATISINQAGTYRVTTTFVDGQHSSAWHVVTASAVAPPPRIEGDTVLCPGSSSSLTAVASTALSYRWSTGATTTAISIIQPGIYSLTATYSGGCTQTTQLSVRARSVRIAGSIQLCSLSSAMLSVVAPGASAFRWSTGATTPTITITQPGIYSVQATFTDACILTASQAVTVPQAVIQGDSILCPGQSGQLSAVTPTATAYRWSTGATTSSIAVSQAGTFSVQVFYATGCTSQAQVIVRTVPALGALTIGADTTVCEGAHVQLRVPSTLRQQSGLTYRWNTGATTPTLAVQQSGTYTLQVQSACATQTLTRNIFFQPCLTIPNIITPNGDLSNEHFVVQGLGTAVPWVLELYNRWGKQIYRSAAYQNDWGTGAAPGIYYYLLHQEGNTTMYKGWLQVVL